MREEERVISGMEDRRISLSWSAAAVCWVVGTMLEISSAFGCAWAGGVGTVLIAVAVTVSVKALLCQMWQCEITAFRLGQKVERERARTPMHSVH